MGDIHTSSHGDFPRPLEHRHAGWTPARHAAPSSTRGAHRLGPGRAARFGLSSDHGGWAPTLLGVWAHPDDEAYLSAALMHRVVAAGGRVVVVTATRGEQGTPDGAADRLRFGRHREGELRQALAAVGVDELVMLGLPDGGCADVTDDGPLRVIEHVMNDVEPDIVVTFGPDGITHHDDHVAVGRWTTEAWLRGGTGRLMYATMGTSFLRRNEALHDRLGVSMGGALESVADLELDFVVRPDESERRAKRDALDAHASQSSQLVGMMGYEQFHDWWVDEMFRDPRAADFARFGVQQRELVAS